MSRTPPPHLWNIPSPSTFLQTLSGPLDLSSGTSIPAIAPFPLKVAKLAMPLSWNFPLGHGWLSPNSPVHHSSSVKQKGTQTPQGRERF